MRKPIEITTLTLALASFVAVPVAARGASPQEPPTREQEPGGGLARAQALFEKVDLDEDGFVSAVEAGRHKIPGKEFVAHDDDRDRRLSVEEFTLFYRQLLIRAGRPVSTDLDEEAARIASARKAREVQETEKVTAGPKPTSEKVVRTPDPVEKPRVGTGEVQGPPSDAERIAKAREDQRNAEAERIAKARSDQQAAEAERIAKARDAEKAAEAERVAQAAGEQQRTEAERIAKAREDQRQSESERASRVRELQRAAEAQRIAKAREDLQRAEAERIAKARESQEKDPAVGPDRGTPPKTKSPEERAQGYVKRLVDAGRLTAAQARDYYDFLTATPTEPINARRATELRASLHRAKGRISTLVRNGDLSAQEGVQLSSVLDSRAGAILPAEEPARTREKKAGDAGTRKGDAGGGPERGARKKDSGRRDG